MAQTDVALNITGNASQQLSKIQQQTQKLNDTFGQMRSALAGIAIGSFINNMVNGAKATMDLAGATGFAVQSILGLQRAFIANGGSAEIANQAISKLTQNIGEAAQGSAALQASFAEVGISLEDLATLTEEEIFMKTIQGLAGISDAGTRAALGLELLGKAAKTIDYAGIASGAKNYIDSASEQARAVEAADAASKKLEETLEDIKQKIFEISGPFLEFINNINVSTKAIADFIGAAVKIAVVVASFSLAGKVFRGFFLIIANIPRAIASIVVGFKSLGTTFQRILQQFTRFKAAGEITSKTIQGLTTRFKFLKEGLDLIKNGVGFIGGLITSAFAVLAPEKFGDALSWIGEKLGIVQTEAEKAAIAEQKAAEQAARAAEQAERDKRRIVVANQSLISSINNVSRAYTDQITALRDGIAEQTKQLTISSDQLELDKALQTVNENNAKALEALAAQREKLTREQSSPEVLAAIDNQTRALKIQLEIDKTLTTEAIQGLQKRRLEQERLNDQLELTRQNLSDTQALNNLNAELALVGQYGDELENNMLILKVTQDLQSKLTELTVKQLELENQRVQLGEARFQQELQHLNALRDAAYEYAGARLEAEQQILEAQRATQENARLGVEQAMDDIAKQFEPYQQAQDAVKQGWNRISGAIDDFIETGKFNFKDFARSVLADLAKMIAKALVFKAIQSALGFFGLSLPGLAKGGPAQGNKPYIVGEQGPELFVPRTSGTVVPNNKLASMEGRGEISAPITNNYITNNINAVDAKSVAQLFAENRKTLLGAVATAQREMPYMA